MADYCNVFLLADLMPFGRRAVIRAEQTRDNRTLQQYVTVTYWYALPAPSLIKTDSIDIGNVMDEQKHDYDSSQASSVQTVTSRYAWGIDTFATQLWPFNDPGTLNRLRPDVAPPAGYEQLANTEVFP